VASRRLQQREPTAAGSGRDRTGGGQACKPPNPNGPAEIHTDQNAPNYDTVPCDFCHPGKYIGGYLYTSPTSDTPVAQATVTLTPTGSSAMTAVTGPSGMFYYSGAIKAPYDVCVSKCPDTVCSGTKDHPDAQDCGVCHGQTTTKIHLP